MPATLFQMLDLLIANKASDLHLVPGHPPEARIHGQLLPIQGEAILTPTLVHDYAWQIMDENQRVTFEKQLELDSSYQYQDKARFRVNTYTVKGTTAVSMRLIPMKIASVDELRLPPICHRVATLHSGFILVTGPTGTGKSSTLAAILEEINQTRAEHILTIEDPIEFVYTPARSIISQREVGHDVLSWTNALRTAMRQDPDIVLVGEMRDLETIAAALTVAETGHLVFATLHTNSAPETIDRIIDVFPQGQQPQIRQQLASTLKAVLSQRLVPTADGQSRVAVMESLLSNSAVANLIREAKTFQIDNVMQTATEEGMMLMEKHLAQYVTAGVITYEEALKFAIRPKELDRSLGR